MSAQFKQDGGPAFPALPPMYVIAEGKVEAMESGGMSLLDYFAAHAPEAEVAMIEARMFRSEPSIDETFGPGDRYYDYTVPATRVAERFAAARMLWAEAMLKQREAKS